MIKILLINLLLFIPAFCSSQMSDSLITVTKIEQLLSESQVCLDSQKMDLVFKKLALAKSICLKKLGLKSLSFGKISFTLGNYYEELGDYTNAEKCYSEAISCYKHIEALQNLDYANVLNAMAGIYTDQGQIDKAKNLYETAIAIRALKLGRDHIDYAGALNNLAGIYHILGAYDSAIILFKEVQVIFIKSLGSANLHYAQVTHNLANVYIEIGNFNQAEILYRESLAIREKINGRSDPSCAASLNCLGNLYLRMGNWENGLNYYQEALQIYIKTEGHKSLSTAACMNNIARIFYENGQFELAETNYLKALDIYKNTIGSESPDYAMCIDNLANMYATKKDFVKAEQLYLEALKIRQNIFGQKHIEYGMSLNNLGAYYSVRNDTIKAETYLLKAQDLWAHIFGKEHPDYLLALNNLIIQYWLTGNYAQLGSKLMESIQIEKNLVFRASKHLSEIELAKYINSFSSNLDRLFSFNSTSNQLNSTCYNSLLFYKAYLLNANAQLSNLAHRDSIHLQLYNKLRGLHQNLSKQLSLPTADRAVENIKLLEEEINSQEKELQRMVFGDVDLHKDVSYQDVLNYLKPNEAAIEFVHYKFSDPIPTGKINYAALILKPGLLEPIVIQLCDQNALDSVLHSSMERKADYVNSLYTISDRGAKSIGPRSRNLSELIWKPLEQQLTGIKTIYYSSSGLLHRINLDAIPINALATLSDSFHLIALGSTRQLLVPAKENFIHKKVMLFGGINFEPITQLESTNMNSTLSETGHQQKSGLNNASVSTWEFLSGTEREVDALDIILRKDQFEVCKYKAYDALEDSVKIIGLGQNLSPRILHFATHGYFFPDQKNISKQSAVSIQSESVFKISNHPMLRSGLIMAGGNAAWQGIPTPEGKEDGILTAYEISQMNLSNTELVVLSACETGLGDIQGNEGVYGLQRAFKIAGAKYLIMSLWQVPDKQTSLLMTTFYKKWLENKMTIPNAFHAAQKELRDLGLDPYQWAGFILVE